MRTVQPFRTSSSTIVDDIAFSLCLSLFPVSLAAMTASMAM